MKSILNSLINHEVLTREESRNVLVQIAEGRCNTSQIAAFLTVFMMRSITIAELEGFRDALMELCKPVDLSDYSPIDLCGTGGDGKNTFNISTLASFVTAAAGVPVAKHGNYGVSSNCGSSNVLEFLGVSFSDETDHLRRCMDKAGISILHAPLFHPAMKHVAPIRKELAVKTFFNMLGPMVNPASPPHQMVGVFNLELARIYSYLYQNTDTNYCIVHSLDGYDEISLTGETKILRRDQEMVLSPGDLGMETLEAAEIFGGHSVDDAAQLFMNVLQGKGTPAQNSVVCTNAGMAIATAENIAVDAGIARAFAALESGKALDSLRKLQGLSKLA